MFPYNFSQVMPPSLPRNDHIPAFRRHSRFECIYDKHIVMIQRSADVDASFLHLLSLHGPSFPNISAKLWSLLLSNIGRS